jgi:hypothetical protein
MPEERFVTGTKIVQSFLTIRSLQKSVLWALSIAGEAHIAFQTMLRENIPLGFSKLGLLFGIDQRLKRIIGILVVNNG